MKDIAQALLLNRTLVTEYYHKFSLHRPTSDMHINKYTYYRFDFTLQRQMQATAAMIKSKRPPEPIAIYFRESPDSDVGFSDVGVCRNWKIDILNDTTVPFSFKQ